MPKRYTIRVTGEKVTPAIVKSAIRTFSHTAGWGTLSVFYLMGEGKETHRVDTILDDEEMIVLETYSRAHDVSINKTVAIMLHVYYLRGVCKDGMIDREGMSMLSMAEIEELFEMKLDEEKMAMLCDYLEGGEDWIQKVRALALRGVLEKRRKEMFYDRIEKLIQEINSLGAEKISTYEDLSISMLKELVYNYPYMIGTVERFLSLLSAGEESTELEKTAYVIRNKAFIHRENS